MGALDIADRDLARVIDAPAALAKQYRAFVEERRVCPATSDTETQRLFQRSGDPVATVGDLLACKEFAGNA